MATPIMSHKKAHSLSFALFLIGLALISYFKYWWPGIMLTIGLPIALRQYLLGKRFDMIVSLIVFLGVFITVQFNIKWEIVLPVLFTIGGFYVFFKEFFGPKEESEEEIEEEKNIEIEEEEEEQKEKKIKR
jgi:predicted membrane protein